MARLIGKATDSLHRTGGDIFALFIEMFDSTIEYSEDAKHDHIVLRNLYLSMYSSSLRPEDNIDMQEMLYFREEHLSFKKLTNLVNLEKLKLNCVEQLESLFTILFSVTRQSISRALNNISNAQEARKHFISMLNIIQYGALKLEFSSLGK